MSDRQVRPKKKKAEQTFTPLPVPSQEPADKPTNGETSCAPQSKASDPTTASQAKTPPTPAIEWREVEVNVAELQPYERNPRKITAEAYAELKKRIIQDGYHQRALATHDIKIIGGHQRRKIFTELGWSRMKVLVPNRELTEEEFRRILVRDNLPQSGQFDWDVVASDFDVPELVSWGVPPKWMDLIPSGEESNEADEVVPLPSYNATVSKIGDIWLCGDHRVMCGDSTNASDVERLLGEALPNLMVTDPPYGVEYDADWRNKRMCANGQKIKGRATGKVANDHQADWRETYALFPGNVIYAWCASLYSDVAIDAIESVGFKRRSQIIWAKNMFAIGRGDYHWQHEPCWYAVRDGEKSNWCGDRSQSTLWNIDKPRKSDSGHSTQKPIACMRKPIENHTQPGDSIYDPFLGSGTSLVAAEQIGRMCFGMEIEPGYVDVAVKRWEKETGKKAVLEDNGDTFESAAKIRLG